MRASLAAKPGLIKTQRRLIEKELKAGVGISNIRDVKGSIKDS